MKKNYLKPRAEWISFQVEEALLAEANVSNSASVSIGTEPNPFETDGGTSAASYQLP